MLQHKVRIVSNSHIELIQAAFKWAALGKLDSTNKINTIAMPYSFWVNVDQKGLLPQEGGNIFLVKNKALEDYLDRTDLDELRILAASYGAKEDTTRLEIKRLVKAYASA